MRYESLLETIGATPSVRLHRMAPIGVQLYVKMESYNPTGSSKDRLARALIAQGERSGGLRPGQTVVYATSGNGGISLAMVCAHKGYPLVVVMPENFSLERRRLMRFMGAQVILTPAEYYCSGAVAKAQELAVTHGWYLCDQFDNPENSQTHAQTTAREIVRDFADCPLDYWVTGYGSGGTLSGVAQVLRQVSPDTQIVVCEPNNAQLLAATEASEPALVGAQRFASHPEFRPHLMQGWTPDFISPLTQSAVGEGCIDQLLPIDGTEALQACRQLARLEGIVTGVSGGAVLAGALKLAQQVAPDSTILCILPDTGERYQSTPLFEHIEDQMNEEERRLAESTPNYRFNRQVSPLPVMEVDEREPLVTEISQQMLLQFIHNPRRPVVLFALQWCEFSWSVRKLFNKLSIPFHGIDLDSPAYRACQLGSKLKATLVAHTGQSTIPQVFIGGEFLGGCIELFDAVNSRSLFAMLDRAGVDYNRVVDIDPYTLLPGWTHRREPA